MFLRISRRYEIMFNGQRSFGLPTVLRPSAMYLLKYARYPNCNSEKIGFFWKNQKGEMDVNAILTPYLRQFYHDQRALSSMHSLFQNSPLKSFPKTFCILPDDIIFRPLPCESQRSHLARPSAFPSFLISFFKSSCNSISFNFHSRSVINFIFVPQFRRCPECVSYL